MPNLNANVKFASAERCVSFCMNTSRNALIAGSSRNTVEFLLKFLIDVVSVKYPEEVFMFFTESYADYEDTHKDWYQVQNGCVINVKEYILFNNEYEKVEYGNESLPTWFVDHAIGSLVHNIICMSNRRTNDKTIEFYGDFNAEDNDIFLEIAKRVSSHSSFEYIQYDVENIYCVSNGKKILIDSLCEKHLEYYFEIKPEIVNKTATLFEINCAELLLIYGDMNKAKIAYNKGEFALYETKEGLKFYAVWRKKGWSDRKAILIALGHKPIEGVEVAQNPLYLDAQQKFSVDALQYWISNNPYYFGTEYNKEIDKVCFEYKIVQENGKLIKVDFHLCNYYPI